MWDYVGMMQVYALCISCEAGVVVVGVCMVFLLVCFSVLFTMMVMHTHTHMHILTLSLYVSLFSSLWLEMKGGGGDVHFGFPSYG